MSPDALRSDVDEERRQYKSGDVVNNHILATNGQWLPLGVSAGASGGQLPPVGPHIGQGDQPNGFPQPVFVVQTVDSNNTSLAPVTSLVAGLFGLFLGWIPIIGIVGWILGPIAVLFGILGLGRGKTEHKLMSWFGIGLGALTLLICILYVLVIFAGS